MQVEYSSTTHAASLLLLLLLWLLLLPPSTAEVNSLLGYTGTGLALCPAAAPQAPGLQDIQGHHVLTWLFGRVECWTLHVEQQVRL
jgi:hypothetical protein